MRNTNLLRSLLLVWLFAAAYSQALQAQCPNNNPTSPLGIVPTISTLPNAAAFPNCGTDYPSMKTGEPIISGSFALGGVGNSILFTLATDPTCGPIVNWSTAASPSIVVDYIKIRRGTLSNNYNYTGLYASADNGLHADPSASAYRAISEAGICYHYRLLVSKTVLTSFVRTYSWSVTADCPTTELELGSGEAANVPFGWTASSTYVDSDFKVYGVITVINHSPIATLITGISDIVSPSNSVPTFSAISFPYLLASDDTLTIAYIADVPDASSGTNTVTVTSGTQFVEGNSATVPYTFSAEPSGWSDLCATVTDCTGETLVCFESAPYTNNYVCAVGPYECGDHTYTNAVSLVTNNTGSTDAASCDVAVTVTCGEGCTQGQGYWKNNLGDPTWALLDGGPNATFFLSGQTWIQVFNTPPAGDVYYILAHQYMAAVLNILSGASSTPEVDAAIAWAITFFSTYTPGSSLTSEVHDELIANADLLESYNSGEIGPGPCVVEEAAPRHNPETVATALLVYPNPATNQLYLDLRAYAADEDLQVVMFDMQGKRVVEQNFGGHGGETVSMNLNRTGMPAGQYLLVLQHKNGKAQTVVTIRE